MENEQNMDDNDTMDMTGMEEDDSILYAEDITEEFECSEAPIDDMDVEDNSIELDSPLQLFTGHSDAVYAIANHNDLLISGGGDDVAILWDKNTMEAKHILRGHSDSVVAVGFNADGNLVATGGYDGIVKVWNVSDGKLIMSLEGPSEEIEWFTWHQKGNVILAGSGDGTVWLWLATTGDCMHVLAGHEGGVTCGSFTGSGKMAVTGSQDGTVRLWNPKTGTCAHVFRGHGFHEGPISTLACHPTQPLCLSGSQDGTACLVALQSKKVLVRLTHMRKHDGVDEERSVHSIESVGFCSTLNWCATACLGGELRIWDLDNYVCRHICRHQDGITKLRWHATQPLILTVCVDGSAWWWDARSGQCLTRIQCHQEMILDVALEGNATEFYTSSDDHSIRKFT